MDLRALLSLIRPPGYARLGEPAVVLEEAKASVVAALAEEHPGPVLLVTARQARAVSLCEQLQGWLGPSADVHLFPEPDVLPYERLDPDGQVIAQRLRSMHALLQGRRDGIPLVVVAPVHALASRTLAPEEFLEATVAVRGGQRFDWEGTASQLIRTGYRRVETVRGPGEFARRGGIIDVFPAQMEEPVRVELWGDEVDNLRAFDAASQRSTQLLQTVIISPARELIPKEMKRSRKGRDPFARDLERLIQGQEIDSYWFYAPLFNHASAAEYLPKGSLTVLDEPLELERGLEELRHQADEGHAELIERAEAPPEFPSSLVDWNRLSDGFRKAGRVLPFRRWGGEGDEAVGFGPVPGYAGRLREALGDIRRAAHARERVVIVSHQSQRLGELLREEGVPIRAVDELAAPPQPGQVSLVHGALPGGWRLDVAGGPLRVVTDSELFGFVKEGRRRATRRAGVREHPLQALAPGDFVVHVEHGIARFTETFTMEEQPGAKKEYLLLAYAGGGRLFVPTDQIDRVTRYVAQGGHEPALSSLGTQAWERAKTRVKAAAANVAKELLQTTAARQMGAGVAFSPDTVWQQELEASFPYVETPDQLQAVHDVTADMEQLQPMDRLVCGDVGYGKTEVAIRAAFKAVQEGMQVAMLVPTTVLAQQHYQTFSQRLGAFPVNIASLSRFQSDKEQHEVLQGLRAGSVDIVVGTHRLLQKDVDFRNLGLVVVDEEQRFGVIHKEYFKRLRTAVDVLTLSATPIPRTLYMSMVGVRDMSVMETPPEERLPIKTYVMEYDEGTVRQAILREIERGGQVFFLHNRVQTIPQVVYRLRQLVPEATFMVAHGQMPEELLERAMVEFTGGEYDVLVCSTIIESGLDLPNVNTILINDADKLGLSQLYQLRGRVGRGSSRAYAYLLYTRNKALTEKAEKRLQAVFEATDLGAGYYIAQKDLEIRGAGNLLGVEQSGQIGAVGFDLYCRILAAAVEDAKAEHAGLPQLSQIPQPPAVSLDLRIPAYLPDDYVPDLDTRLDVYRRLAGAQELAEAEEMEQELYDRFGPLSPAVEHLLFGVRVKVLATRAGVESVSHRGDEVIVQLLEGLRVDRGAFGGLRGVQPGTNQVRVNAGGGPGRWGPVLEEALARLSQ